MFGKIRNIATRVNSLTDDQILDFIMSDDDIKQMMIALNQKQLYELGLQADGSPTGDYSPVTVKIKEASGQPTDHITLKDTGDFYNSMKVTIGYNYARIEADTVKTVDDYKDKGLQVDLLDRWPKALGLTDESIKEILPEVKKRFIAAIRKVVLAA